MVLLRAAILIALVSACGDETPGQDSASADQDVTRSREAVAWKHIEAGALLLDVRTPREFARGHLPGAANIAYDDIADSVHALQKYRNRPVVVYCRSGRRSQIAMRTLQKLGFSDVHNGGGYRALQAAAPVVQPQPQSTGP